MKKFFFTTVLALLVASSSFATDEKNNVEIIKQVSEQFANATEIEVSVKRDFTKVLFTQYAKRIAAFYDFKGQLLGTSQAIDIANLPTSAKRVFAKKYSDFTVTEAIKFEGIEELAYFISGEKDDKRSVLKVTHDGTVSVYTKK